MNKMNYSKFVALLKDCTDIVAARELHSRLRESGRDGSKDTYTGNLLVHMYSNCGSVDDARAAFHRIENKNLFSWTLMMRAFLKGGYFSSILKLSHQMDCEGVQPDSVTLLALVSACTGLQSLQMAKTVADRVRHSDHFFLEKLTNSLITMYGSCGCIELAKAVFDDMAMKSVVSWTSMIAAYARTGHSDSAVELFHVMLSSGIQANEVTFMTVLETCSSLHQVQNLHNLISASSHLRLNVKVLHSLVSSYAKVGSLDHARAVFDKIAEKNVISWTAIMSACVQHEQHQEALQLYRRMNLEGVKPNQVTFASVVSACAEIGESQQAKLIHCQVVAEGYSRDTVVANALVNMYGRCGDLKQAKEIFDEVKVKSSVAWNALISAYARNGHAELVLQLFKEMAMEAVEPTQITCSCILHACSHAGLLVDGLSFFASVTVDHGITAEAEHYVGLIDLLTRAGLIDESQELMVHKDAVQCQDQNVCGNAVAWRTLLAACKVHKLTERGARTAQNALSLVTYSALKVLSAAAHLACCLSSTKS